MFWGWSSQALVHLDGNKKLSEVHLGVRPSGHHMRGLGP